MAEKKHILFVGGDARQLEMIRYFVNKQFRVSLVGYDNLQTPVNGTNLHTLASLELSKIDLLVLPVMGTDQHGYVKALFAQEKIKLMPAHFAAFSKNTLIFTGLATNYLKEQCQTYNLALYELMERDDVAIYNSIPTVEGALMMAIHNTEITIHNAQILVLGLGRVGVSLVRVLKALGAKVTVAVRKNKARARAFEMGLEVISIEELCDKVTGKKMIFNTIPYQIITAEILMAVDYDVFILDLASSPGGVDYKFAEKRGIKAKLAPSLPCLVAPKTAGRILSAAIMDTLRENY
ncbi:MAG: dipicolinic acid synthetase subunit [Bacillota bacterium]